MKDLVKAVALFGIAILTLVAVSSEDVFAQPDRSKGSQNDRSRKARIERAERSINSPKASSRIGRLQWGRPTTPSARAKRTERSRQSQSVRNLRRAKPQRQSHVRKSQPRKRNARAQRRQAFPDLRHWAQRLPRQPRGGYPTFGTGDGPTHRSCPKRFGASKDGWAEEASGVCPDYRKLRKSGGDIFPHLYRE
jgi:hypothetical protein